MRERGSAAGATNKNRSRGREADLVKPGTGRKSLKKYEVANLLFFLGLILVLGALVTFVFRYYSSGERTASDNGEKGIISESLHPGSDIGVFYLGTKIYERGGQYRNILEIPVTDDGFLKELFSIPGVEEITVDQKSIMIRKVPSADWNDIRSQLQQVIERHLHLHY